MSVYDTIREGIADDFRKAREHPGLLEKIERHKCVLEYARQLILKASGFSCIHEHASPNGYCDLCPCTTKGGNQTISHEDSKLLCPLPRRYSK